MSDDFVAGVDKRLVTMVAAILIVAIIILQWLDAEDMVAVEGEGDREVVVVVSVRVVQARMGWLLDYLLADIHMG